MVEENVHGAGDIILNAPSIEARIDTKESWLTNHLAEIFSAGLPGNGSMEPTKVRPVLVYTVSSGTDDLEKKIWQVDRSGVRIFTARTEHELVTGLENEISNQTARSLQDFLLFHSGALIRNGHGILIPGTSGAGKSTTSAALAFAGFEYCTDDVAVFGKDRRLRPFPKVLALKAPGWQVISKNYPESSEAVVYSSGRDGVTYVRPPVLPSAESSRSGVPVDLIFLPRKDDPNAPVIEKISKSEVVKVLTEESLDLQLLGASAFDGLIDLVRGAECHALNVLNLTEAVEAVKELTE
ncbi:MAG: hypothetical protein IH960_08630 [Chloroflexi bacterium]|nr:hypothetical protein [Chloroflexota bacterium]